MTNAYIIKSYRSPESIKLYLDALLEGYTKADYHFFVHLLCGTLASYIKKEDGWVPVSSVLIKKTWGKAGVNFQQMVLDGLLEVKVLDEFTLEDGEIITQTYSRMLGLSREFRMAPEVFDNILEAMPKTDEEFKCKYYNLVNGKAMNKPQARYTKHDENRNLYPELILNAMEAIQVCRVNIKALEDHIAKLTADATDPVFGGGEKAKRALVIDYHSYAHIKSNVVNEENGLVDYRVIFSDKGPQMSGRITEPKGMQGCSRAMKAAGFSDIPGLRNYDLKSSQVFGLIQQLEVAKVDTTWLQEYLSQDKKVYADRVGVSKDRWKQCFMAIIFGAYMPTKVSRKDFEPVKVTKVIDGEKVMKEDSPSDALFKAMFEEAHGNPDLAMELYGKFNEEIKPLKKALNQWQNWLLNTYVKDNSIYPGGKQCVVNKTGMVFDLTPYQGAKGAWKNEDKLKGKLTAFFLQGCEAGFIHWISVLGKDFNYEVLSNQHDGVVVIGEIPQEAVDIAKERSGLRYAELEEKAFN